MKSDRNVLGGNAQRLTESDFRFDVTLSRWRLWRHFVQKRVANYN